MARLKIVDEAKAETFYDDLNKGLGSRKELVIGHNTKLVRLANGSIAVRLYDTNVAVSHPDNRIEFDAGDFLTVTTLDRINRVSSKFGIHARARRVTKNSKLRILSLEGLND